MKELDRVAERTADDRWTAGRLMILGGVTLLLALTVIWILGYVNAPPGYN